MLYVFPVLDEIFPFFSWNQLIINLESHLTLRFNEVLYFSFDFLGKKRVQHREIFIL